MSGGLYETLRARFPRDLAATFIETPQGQRFSYGALLAESGRMANALAAAGAQPGDRVMVQAAKSPQVVFLYLACVRAGLVYLPLNSGYRRDEVDYFLADAEPRLVVCAPDSPLLEATAARGGDCRAFTLDDAGQGSFADACAGLGEAWRDVDRNAGDLAAILYTSGTTGRPKGAMLTQENLASNALALHRAWGFRPPDTLLHALPIFHTHGLFVAINCTLLNGTGMLFLPRFDVDEVTRLLPRATVMMGVPTFYVRLLANPAFTREACRNMRLFIAGSAPLLPETFTAFQARTGHTILERYGMTETSMITSNPLDGERVAGSVGFALPGVELRIADADGRALPTGETGNIEVRGPNVFKGYWRNPAKTREEFRADGFFRTGDLGRVDARGYVHIVGRSKDLVISGGLNVYPKEVETVIDGIAGVAESAVIGVPHPDFGEAVVAVVVAKPGAQRLTPAAVLAATKAQLAAFKNPKSVFIAADLPRNAMGKVEKAKLREHYKDLFK
jgi:malonyl-CoA/methylmalonyl-CoA synthetase